MPRLLICWSLAVLAPTLMAAAASLPVPQFSDHLTGRTVGQVREGQVRLEQTGVILTAGNAVVCYAPTTAQLPVTAGTIAVSLWVADDFQEGCLLSDAYERTTLGVAGTTWPSLRVTARRAGPALFRLTFGYCSAPHPVTGERWHVVDSPALPTGQWLELGFSWGTRGQLLWVGDRIRASSAYCGARATDASTPRFRGWGLGCLYNVLTPYAATPAPERSAYAVRCRNLRLWSDQVWLGPRGKQE